MDLFKELNSLTTQYNMEYLLKDEYFLKLLRQQVRDICLSMNVKEQDIDDIFQDLMYKKYNLTHLLNYDKSRIKFTTYLHTRVKLNVYNLSNCSGCST